jgi:ABC-2 type transport system ATP-binding protein
MIATVLAPDRGQLSLLGRDPSRVAERTEIRHRLGYLPQEPGFHRGFTVFEFVDYVAILKSMTDRRSRHDDVRRVLAATGLESVSAKRIRALSGGLRRRVGLAQALLGDPELLVLDEPTAGLDPEQRLRLRELVSQAGEGRTVVLASHQTEDVAALCTRIAVIHQGRSRFVGTPAELTAQAEGRVWTDAARASTAFAAWRTGEGDYRNVGEPPAGAQLVAPTLEDAYLLLVGDQLEVRA